MEVSRNKTFNCNETYIEYKSQSIRAQQSHFSADPQPPPTSFSLFIIFFEYTVLRIL